jgi:hypothetical protein
MSLYKAIKNNVVMGGTYRIHRKLGNMAYNLQRFCRKTSDEEACEISGPRWEDNIKTNLREIGCEGEK